MTFMLMSPAVLTLLALPTLSLAYTWQFEKNAQQCSNLTITVSGSDGKPPYRVLILPFGATPLPNNVEARKIIDQPFPGNSTTLSFQLPYPADSQLVAVVSFNFLPRMALLDWLCESVSIAYVGQLSSKISTEYPMNRSPFLNVLIESYLRELSTNRLAIRLGLEQAEPVLELKWPPPRTILALIPPPMSPPISCSPSSLRTK